MNQNLMKQALLQSWLGLSFFFVFLGVAILGKDTPEIIGFLAVMMAVLFMNGLANTDILMAQATPSWWKKAKLLKLMHHIHAEGELAGIWVGIVLLIYFYWQGHGSSIHLPFYGALALAGIMAAANIATQKIIPLMNSIEKSIGVWGGRCGLARSSLL